MFQFLRVVPQALIVVIFCFLVSGLARDAQGQMFAPAVNYTVGLRPYNLVSADFDSDGDCDLATGPNVAFDSDGEGWVAVLMNNGDGTFAPPDSYDVGDAPTLAAADLDTNGHADLAVADYFTNRIYILLNDGAGAFMVADSFASGGINPNGLCAPDLDGDGYLDLAVPNSGSNNLSVFFNNGDTTFSGPVLYATGNFPYTAISADLDLDGDSDLVVTNNGAASVSVFINDGTGAFAPRVNYTVRQNPQSPSLADYNGDGCLDLAVPNASPTTPFVSVLMGNCDGTFDPKVDWPGCRPHTVASADYDIDGDIDMAVANVECNNVSIFLNNGNGTFAPHFTLPVGNGPQWIVAKDFESDGNIDLAACNYDNHVTPGDNVSILMNLTTLVIGQPKINTLPETLDFGAVIINQPETLSLNVRNLGYPDTLEVSNITSDTSVFSVDLTTFSVPGASSQVVKVAFNPSLPSAGGLVSANLTITSSDTSNPSDTVPLLGCVLVIVGDLALPLNGNRTPADVVTLINTVFKSKPLPSGVNPCSADVNKSDGPPSPADVVTLINNVFKNKPLPFGNTCGC
ncbi:MAG: VCBS repeat-containing protein [Ignavibacteriae bacterium]|nr:VCBS repeat-containing protein [Ignavibacteriota bacterium]